MDWSPLALDEQRSFRQFTAVATIRHEPYLRFFDISAADISLRHGLRVTFEKGIRAL